MADLKETALGIAAVLGSEDCPDPLLFEFKGQTLAQAAEIIHLAVAECRDADIPLARLELDPDLFLELEYNLDLPMRLNPEMEAAVRFFRGSQIKALV